MTWESQQIRRTALAESCSPVSVVPKPEKLAQLWVAHRQGEPGSCTVGLGEKVRRLQPSAGVDECVKYPDAVVAWVAAVMVAPRCGARVGLADRVVAGRGCGEWNQGGLDQGGVLCGAAAPEPGAAGLVVGDVQVPVEVCGAFEAVEGSFVAPVLTSGVDYGEEAAGELAQFGGVQRLDLTQQHLHSARPQVGVS